jgi:hypothetical protein
LPPLRSRPVLPRRGQRPEAVLPCLWRASRSFRADALPSGAPTAVGRPGVKGIKIDPRKVDGYLDRGITHWKRKNYPLAIADWSKVVEISPGDYMGHNNLAWALATCPDPQFRDGQKALDHAMKACDLSKWKNGRCIETLAAYAEKRNFVQAVKFAHAALLLPDGFSAKDLRDLKAELRLYEAGKPYRDE